MSAQELSETSFHIHRFLSIFLGFIYCGCYALDRYLEHRGPGNRCHFPLYHACLDPTTYKAKAYWTFYEIYIIVTALINISSNLYLFTFLENRRQRLGKFVSDKLIRINNSNLTTFRSKSDWCEETETEKSCSTKKFTLWGDSVCGVFRYLLYLGYICKFN